MTDRTASGLEEGIEAGEDRIPPGRFGTFGGVFTPTLLTILGVILYLREGWVIGNAGLLGGLLVILFGFGITGLTALSMSSIATNLRLGAGGAYAIIAQSLGLEVGGSLGIPRYISQVLAVTMYIFGFREGWRWVFPEHPSLLVDLVTFGLLVAIAYVSADLAIRVQYFIMAVIAASLASVAVAAFQGSMQYPLTNIDLWGTFPGAPETGFQGTDFWIVFAVFFPATTGIMAGANMSGDLEDPRRSIPLGTLSAVGLSLVIYLLVGYWLARSATPQELVANYTVMMDKAAWGPAVLAGLLGATFSSALASTVGSARILQAMGTHGVLPGRHWLSALTEKGEPRNAMIVTGALILGSLMLRDLNAVAPLITLFFLVTYAMINAVVLIEESLNLVSFRPRLRLPWFVPFLGLAGSIFAMFIVNPTLSLVALGVTVGVYVVLVRGHLEAPFGDVRSGLFVALAEWAAKHTSELPTMQERAWKPNLLVPVEDPGDLRGSFEILYSVAAPQGSLKILGLHPGSAHDHLGEKIAPVTWAFRDRGVFASWSEIEYHGFTDGLTVSMQTLRGTFFKPNVVFLRMPSDEQRARDYPEIILEADRQLLGTLLYAPHPRAGLGQRHSINVWIRDRSPDWEITWDIGNLDLSLLTAYQIQRNWNAKLRLVMVVERREDEEEARNFMTRLADLARLDATVVVASGPFDDFLEVAPMGDLNLFGLSPDPDFGFVHRMVEETRSSCLFVRDSGTENALA